MQLRSDLRLEAKGEGKARTQYRPCRSLLNNSRSDCAAPYGVATSLYKCESLTEFRVYKALYR
eukprot:scaffold2429_cov120-Skeletonema_dohrnii-CCMP3373.AAC.2